MSSTWVTVGCDLAGVLECEQADINITAAQPIAAAENLRIGLFCRERKFGAMVRIVSRAAQPAT
nr:hypothetical protein MFLOJ_21040 [Mycobacterium florentinum]